MNVTSLLTYDLSHGNNISPYGFQSIGCRVAIYVDTALWSGIEYKDRPSIGRNIHSGYALKSHTMCLLRRCSVRRCRPLELRHPRRNEIPFDYSHKPIIWTMFGCQNSHQMLSVSLSCIRKLFHIFAGTISTYNLKRIACMWAVRLEYVRIFRFKKYEMQM